MFGAELDDEINSFGKRTIWTPSKVVSRFLYFEQKNVIAGEDLRGLPPIFYNKQTNKTNYLKAL